MQQTDHHATATALADQGVEWAVGAFIDVNGRARGKVVPIALLHELIGGSEHYTPRGLDGLGRMTPDEECFAVPDPATLRVLPTDGRFAVMMADLVHKGQPFELCGRSILKRQLERAASMGYRFMLGVESEFYVFRGEGDPDAPLEPLAASGALAPTAAYDLEATLDAAGFLSRMVSALQQTGFEVYSFDHEGGTGQYEFDFAHDEALAMADKLTLLRIMAKQAAKQSGGFATFMPKPGSGMWGSGAHFNMSLERLEDGENAFRAPDGGPKGLGWTSECLSFVAGMMRHGRTFPAITNPTVNSYKRLVPELTPGEISWAPIYVTYGDNNRACMFRLPANRPAVENRAVDAAANPYLSAALCLAAGLDGIEQGLDPGDPMGDGPVDGTPVLPRTLIEAVEVFEADPLVREVFPQGFIDEYTAMKRAEWNEYHETVSAWERHRYLTAL